MQTSQQFIQNQSMSPQMKPFSFQLPQNEDLNLTLLENIEVDAIKTSGDLNSCSNLLRNFIASKLTHETIEDLPFEDFQKLLGVAQLAMDYYTQNQEKKEQLINSRIAGLQQKQEMLQKLTEMQKKQEEKKQNIGAQQDKLHREYDEIKRKVANSVNYKCHICHLVLQNREAMREHVENKHTTAVVEQQVNPDYLSAMLSQLQQQQTQNQQNVSGNSAVFAATGQSWGLGNVGSLGSKGFEDLKRRQEDKVKRREERRRLREKKREVDKQQRLVVLFNFFLPIHQKIQLQQDMMWQMQNGIQGLMENKMNELKNLHESLYVQQNKLSEDNKKIMGSLQQPIMVSPSFYRTSKNQQIEPIEQARSEENDPYEKSFHDNNYYDEFEQDYEQAINLSDNQVKDKSRLNVTTDQSAIMSFNNISYSDNSYIQIRMNQGNTNNVVPKDLNQRQQVGNMLHIGELESDNEDQQQQHVYLSNKDQQQFVDIQQDSNEEWKIGIPKGQITIL